MEIVKSEIFRYTSLHPASTEKKSSSALSETSLCSCGDHHVTLFCRSHDTLMCKTCKHKTHMRCHVEKLEHVAKGVLESKELGTTLKDLTTLKYVFQKMKENRRLKTLQHRQEKRSIMQISKRWNMLKSTRSALKREVGLGMDKHRHNLEVLEKLMAKQSTLVSKQINDYLNDFSEFLDNGNEIGTFILLHRAKKDLKTFRNVLNEITDEQNADDIFEQLRTMVSGIYYCENQGSVMLSRSLKPNYSVTFPTLNENNRRIHTPEESYSSALHTPHNRSRLSSASRRFRPAFRPQTIRMATCLSSLCSGRSSRAFTRTSLNLKRLIAEERPKKFSINPPSVSEESQVTAMCHLPGGELLAIDCKNNKIKLFSKTDVFLMELEMECSVWDVAVVSKYEVLVTCPSEGKLQRVKLTNETRGLELAKTSYILTKKECRAICFNSNKIYVSYSGIKPCIKILSKDGIMFRSIEPFMEKKTLFKNPLYMLVTKLGKLIYVSDFSLQRVAKIDQRGNLKGIIDIRPGWPLGLSLTREEKLIIATSGTNDIKITTRGGIKLNTLVGPDVLEGDPCAITVKETNEGKQLYVACSSSNVVNVFKMV